MDDIESLEKMSLSHRISYFKLKNKCYHKFCLTLYTSLKVMLLYFFFWYKSVFFYLKKRRRRKKKRIDKISIYCCRCSFPFPRPKFLGSTHALRLLRQNDGRKTYCRRVFVTMVKNTTHCAYQKLGINRVLVCFNPVGEMASKSAFRLFLFNLYFP